jgi:hypothetical protein
MKCIGDSRSRRAPGGRCDAVVFALESRVMLSGVTPGLLALPTENLVRGRHDFSDTWHALASVTKPSSKSVSYLHASKFDAFKLDEADLRATLALAPMEFTPGADRPVEVDLPTPDGSSERFAVVESSVMDPKLAAKFPGIKTYRGQGIDDSLATVRLDLTPLGFHAQVLSPGRSYYIDPYWHLNKSAYAAYWSKDVPGRSGSGVDDLDAASLTATSASTTSFDALQRPSGSTLRTYRAAVADDGEYTTFFGGTVSAGQAAVVTSINRVTGIYETELSIRLSLIANNSSLIYTNAKTDPYTNTNGSTMLTQNQNNITSVIGSANYDIGHVFSTGGGGVAYLGCVGQTSTKAKGVTGSPSPVGDAYDVDYVAHEMGHQFGGNHTFNTAFDTGNRNAATAYEPGSGSTIMAYAGLEGTDDLQPHSDPYFAWKSLDEIIAYVDDSIPGVGTRVATGDAVPTVNGGADYTIPTSTPFALTAVGNDPDAGQTLTYSWEESDLGPATNLNTADNGSSPLFRVYNPTTSPTRTFPKLASILSGQNYTTTSNASSQVERLPTLARAMKFRVTVRDNRAGGAAVNGDDVVVNVVNTGSGFLITSQNSAATFPAGSQQTITWNVAGTTANGINASSVNVRLSTDGGQTFPTLLASNVSNDGSETVTIPAVATTQARIKVEPTGNVFFDINNANLTITANTATAAPDAPDLLATTDTGTSSTDNVTMRDNSTLPKNLQFSVGNTVPGATVTIYADGTAIGSTTASSATTTVATNGGFDLVDGTHTITARQTDVPNGKTESADSASLGITVDTVAPTADVADVAPDPRTAAVSLIPINFSQAVAGVDLADLSLTRDGGSNLLTGTNAPTTSNNVVFNVPSLSSITNVSGSYTLALTAAGSGITDAAGNALAASASDSWVLSLPTWLAPGSAASWNISTKALSVTGAATVIADPGSDNPSVSASGAGANLTINPASGNAIHFASLSLTSGATATITSLGGSRTAGNHRVLMIGAANSIIDVTSTLDLTDNDLLVDYASPATNPIATVQGMVAAGFHNGDWLGKRITSSVAAAPAQGGNYALGVADNATLTNPFGNGTTTGPLFAGQSVDTTTVIVKFTHRVDLDVDGLVTGNDSAIFNGAFSEGDSGATWQTGDVDYDGLWAGNDSAIFNSFYDESLAQI